METKEFRTAIPKNSRTIRFVSNSMGIGDEIIDALARKGMSQRDLAQKLGCTETLVSRWLGGLQNFTLRTIAHIEEVLEQDLILTPKKAKEKYREQAQIIIREVIISQALNEQLRDLPPHESYSVKVPVARKHTLQSFHAASLRRNNWQHIETV